MDVGISSLTSSSKSNLFACNCPPSSRHAMVDNFGGKHRTLKQKTTFSSSTRASLEVTVTGCHHWVSACAVSPRRPSWSWFWPRTQNKVMKPLWSRKSRDNFRPQNQTVCMKTTHFLFQQDQKPIRLERPQFLEYYPFLVTMGSVC
jgi:hypothetical protein